MSAPTGHKEFNAVSVPLTGSNLIEASAGTGKTYSIAILALRLILEEKISVKEILMVTFTNKAVAELESRIRLFIRKAWLEATGKGQDDKTISCIVQKATEKEGKKAVIQSLDMALLLLDETSVMTIHSFCSQTLKEFAFETKMPLDTEMLKDEDKLITEEVNHFWRNYITGLSEDLLCYLLESGFSKEKIKDIVREHLSGKTFLDYQDQKDYSEIVSNCGYFAGQLKELKEKELELRKCLEEYISENKQDLLERSRTNRYAKNRLPGLLSSPADFVAEIETRTDKAYIISLFPDILEQLTGCHQALKSFREALSGACSQIFCFAIQVIPPQLERRKTRRNQLGFEDIISKIHRTVMDGSNKSLRESLQKKYKAVFIDEFQDTDRIQYEIFHKSFQGKAVIFYIGDPKQSIYGWRKADLNTYFNAKAHADTVYSMNINYRSSGDFIRSANDFFNIDDPFAYGDSAEKIEYIEVNAPESNSKGFLRKGSETDKGIEIFSCSGKDSIAESAAGKIAGLLQENSIYSIERNGESRKIRPSDIGVLVRGKYEGKNIQKQLSRLGIPTATLFDEKVLRSEEAGYLVYLLQAIDEPKKQNINKALYTPLTELQLEDIPCLKEEKITEAFKEYKKRWNLSGVYPAIMNFMADFNTRAALLSSGTKGGERILTNLLHLTELAHKIQLQKSLSAPELIAWLRRASEGMEAEGDEYELRMESDEEAVQIITIHKSKGLEFPIVFAPYLDLANDNRNPFGSFRDPETGAYSYGEKSRFTPEQNDWFLKQNRQENRRLIYVALTRAVYKCFIFKNKSDSDLNDFIKPLEGGKKSEHILFSEIPEAQKESIRIKNSFAKGLNPVPVLKDFSLVQGNWQVSSYTHLSVKTASRPVFAGNVPETNYDQFVFSELSRGRQTGNMLHYIFERIHFNEPDKWEKVLNDTLTRFASDKKENWVPLLKDLLNETLNASVEIGTEKFKLSDISFHKRIHEFEFDFPVSLFSPRDLDELSGPGMQVHASPLPELEGIINGKMDLFFEHGGKYYILDWKSNFLGSSVEDYHPETLTAVMDEQNFHLQYLIYSLAAKKYLESRLKITMDEESYKQFFGGVIYCFIRGMRKNSVNGIYSSKPSFEKIYQLEKIFDKEPEAI